ncbi:MATE family efflux transporter [Lachnoclostridium sp. Marseille-P6806]|uniref:MATE family efflux transporter n=1 Tax=Lachnoclostridium sp. Marseille-P6806 TaxID=2364793 RepID=UPI0010313994|nr:MATE family efflux transporter [Lachnoclostridium sp. Marseille-P6806]
MREGIFTDHNFNRKLITLTLPIALQSLMLASVAAADAVMLGRLDQNSMAAVSLATQVQFVMNMFLFAETGAASILGAQYWGKQDLKTLDDIFCRILRMITLIDTAFFVACVFFPEFLMLFFTNDAELARIGAGYLRIAGWSYLLTGFSECYLTMMRISEHVSRSAWISSGAVVLNVVLNAIFIYGLLGLPSMGADGAALATLISRVIQLIWCVVSSYQSGFLHPRLRGLLRRNRLLNMDFRKISFPILGASLLWGVGFTSYTAIMGHMGADAAAANSVAAVVRDLMCCLCNGISSAGAIILGNELGAGKLEKAKLYGKRLCILSFLIGFLTMGLILAATPLIAHFMILTEKARSYLVGMLVITSVYMIGRCVNTVVINGIFDGGGDTKFDVYSLAVSMWCFALPAAFAGAFVLHLPVLVVYACTCLDEVGKIPWVMLHFRKYLWVRNLTREM